MKLYYLETANGYWCGEFKFNDELQKSETRDIKKANVFSNVKILEGNQAVIRNMLGIESKIASMSAETYAGLFVTKNDKIPEKFNPEELSEPAQSELLDKVRKDMGEILIKNDVVGFVVISTPARVEYLTHLSTSWTVFTDFEDSERAKSIRIHADINTKKEHVEYSVGSLMAIGALVGDFASFVKKIVSDLGEKMDISMNMEKLEGDDY